jgi:hypothetical protein
MAQPNPYEREFDYDPLAPPNVPEVGARLNAEFDGIAETFEQYRYNIGLIQRDDGKLANQSVHPFALSARVRTLIAGWHLRGYWETATVYEPQDVVARDGAFYACLEAHTSDDFDADVLAEKWLPWYEENVTPGPGTITTEMLAPTIVFDASRIRVPSSIGAPPRILVFNDQGVPSVVTVRDAVSGLIDEAVPPGLIGPYYGDLDDLPDDWQVADGTNGTPNVRGRFVVAVDNDTYLFGGTGGQAVSTTNAAGAHSHGGATGSHALTINQIPAHNHTYENVTSGSGSPFLAGAVAWGKVTQNTGNAGGGEGHTHTIAAAETHTHTVATLPPFIALPVVAKVAASSGGSGGGGSGPTPALVIPVPDPTFQPALNQTGAYFYCTEATGCAIAIPAFADVAFPVGSMLTFEQAAAGPLTFTGASGVDINVAPTHLAATVDQHAVVQLIKVASDTWTIYGNLEVAP